jgi:CheY-like chemotaxis protein
MPEETLSLSKTEFVSQVADAYGHLYDLVYLRTHPLADALVPDPSLPRKEKAWQLHHILLNVIGELEPGTQVPALSRQWRRHRLMVLRYVKGLDPEAVADQLTVSRRHYYREHKIAIEALAGILWDRYVTHPPTSHHRPESIEEQASLSRLELLRLEAARMAQASRYARVGDVIRGVLPLLHEMLHQRELDVCLALPEPLPGVSIDQNLLRQMFLGMLGHLIERADQATLQLTAQVEEAAVCLSVRVEPPAAVQPTVQAEAEEQLSTFEEMATLSSAHILPVRAGQSITGFDVELPRAERTVLVVDDNEDVLELFRRYLSPHYRVVTTQTAQQTLDLARRLQPYAVTLDLMMPDQDGWDLLQVLLNQADTRHIPIIVCTVLKQKALALSLGATVFLEKPITERALLSALEALEEENEQMSK